MRRFTRCTNGSATDLFRRRSSGPTSHAGSGPGSRRSRADRSRRRRASLRQRATEHKLAEERLESRIALSVNVAGYENAIDFFAQAPNFQDQDGFRRAPHSPQHTVHGRAIVASDDGSDVFIRQVASVTQDLIVDTSSNFLNYKIIDNIDGGYQQLFVTNGTLRNEPNPIRAVAGRPYDSGTANNWRTEFQLTDCEIYPGTVRGSIRYTQADGSVSTWTFDTALRLTGPGFNAVPLPVGHIRPLAVGLLDNPDDDIFTPETETQQSTMFVDWSDRPNPFNGCFLDAFYTTGDEENDPLFDTGPFTRPGFTRNTPATVATIEREDPTLGGGTLYQVVELVMPGALSTLQDGVTQRQSLGIIPGSYRGETGAITITWSDNIARPLPAFRADVNGVLRFNTFQPGPGVAYTGSLYKDSSWYFTPETFGSGSTAGLIDVRGTIRTDGILELEFRKWNELETRFNDFTDETGAGYEGFAYNTANPLFAGPGPVVVQNVSYLTYTRDTEPNSATFFAGQTITREVTVDLLAPGSTINVDSPILVDPAIESYFNFVTPQRLQRPDIDLRATNINIRAEMTSPDRLSIGRSQVARERLSIPPDDVNPYLLSPSMPSLFDRDPPEPPILPNGGFPDIRQAAAIVEVNSRGQVAAIVPLPGYEGYGYDPDNPPVVTLDAPPNVAGGGSSTGNARATARAIVGRDGRITGYVVTNPGAGYPTTLGNRPQVTITPPTEQSAAAARVAQINAVTGEVVSIDLLQPGYRYHAPPRVIVAPPDLTGFGVQATARAVIDPEGRVVRIEVVDPGSGYTQRPVVTVAAPSPIAMAERLIVEAEIRANVYEIYVGDDFGTDVPRGLAKLSANGSLSIQPVPAVIEFVIPPPSGQRPEDVNQRVGLRGIAPGGGFPAGFDPTGVELSGPGIRQGTRVISYDPITFIAELPPLAVSQSVGFPLAAELSARANSLYLEATTADVYLEGQVNVDKQSYLIHSPPAAAYLAPFIFTTRSLAAGIQSGELEGRVIDITMGNDAQTPLAGSTAEHVVDLRTAVDSLRVRAASSAVDPQGPYPYRLTIDELDTLSVDAVAASSLPISISAAAGILLTSGIDTDGDVSLNAQSSDGTRATLRLTAPIRTRFGRVSLGGDTVEVRNSLEVTSAAVVGGRQDVVIEARGGNLVLQGNIYAPNNVAIEQFDRVDDIQDVAITEVFPIDPEADTSVRFRLSLPDGSALPDTFDPTGLGFDDAVATPDNVSRGARISAFDRSTGIATAPFLYATPQDQFFSTTPLLPGDNAGGVGTNQATVLAATTPIVRNPNVAPPALPSIVRVEKNSLWIRDAVVGDIVQLFDAAFNFLEAWQITRVNVQAGEVTLAVPATYTLPDAVVSIGFRLGTQWSRRVELNTRLEFLDDQGLSLGTTRVVAINRDTGTLQLTSLVPVGAATIRRPPTVLPILLGGVQDPRYQIRLAESRRSITFGEIDGNLARIVADELSVIAEGKVAIRTDVNRLRATAGRGFALSELNDVSIPLLASGGLVSLEAFGVDLGPKGQNPVALTATLVDVVQLSVNTPNGSARIDANTDKTLLVGDAVTISKLGDRAPGMLAAGDVTIRSQSGDIVLLDAPLAGGSARAVRVASSGPLPATATYLPGVPGLTPSTLSGAGSLNAVGDRFWGTDSLGRPIQLAVGDLVLLKDQPQVRAATATVTAASVSAGGTRVTYTAANSFVVGQTVSIAGLSQFNLSGVQIVAASPTAFTVATTGAVGAPVTAATGTATVTQFGSPTVDHKRENGVYRVAALGGGTFGSQRWQLVRDAASDTSIDMPNGTLVRVVEGTFANQAFAVTYDSIVPTLIERVGTNQLQFPLLFPNFDLLEVGGVVNGTGIAPNSFITAVDPVARVVTLDVVNPGQVFDSGIVTIELDDAGNPVLDDAGNPVTRRGGKVLSAAGDTLTLAPSFTDAKFRLLAVGQQVTGPGILAGSVIMRIDPTTRQIDVAKTLLGPAVVSVVGDQLTFDPRDTDAPFTQYSQLAVGQLVQLFDSEARLLETRTIASIDLADQLTRRVILDLPAPAAAEAVTARIWSPGAVAPVLSGTANPATAQVPVGEVRPSSIVFRAANRLAGVRAGQLFRFVDAAGVPVAGVAPQPVVGITIRVALDGVTVEGDVTVGFNALLTPAQLAAVRSAAGGAAVEFLPPDQVAFGVAAPRSVPVTWNSWTAANVFDGTVMQSNRYTDVVARPGDAVSTRIAAIPPESVVVHTAVIDAGGAGTANLTVQQPQNFFSAAVVGQTVQFLSAPGTGDGQNAFIPPLPPVTAALGGGVNTTVATLAGTLLVPISPFFANLVSGQTVQFLAAGTDAVLGTATITSFTAAANILELSGTIPAGTVSIRRLNVATITALDPTTGAITLSEPTPTNAAQVRLLTNTAPLLRGVGVNTALVAPYSPLFLWAQAGHTAEILDPAGITILASLTITTLDPVTGAIGLSGVIPNGAGLFRIGNLAAIRPASAFFDLAIVGDVVEFVDALGTVLPGTGRVTRFERELGGVLLDVAVPARTARFRLPNVATVGASSNFFAFARTGAPVTFRDTASGIVAAPGRTITGLDSAVGTVRFDLAIPPTAAFVEVTVPAGIMVLANNSPFFDLAREGDEVQFANAAGSPLASAPTDIGALNARLGQVVIQGRPPGSAGAPVLLGAPAGTTQVRILGGNVLNVAAGSEFFSRVLPGNRVRFLNGQSDTLVFPSGDPIEATVSSVGRVLPDGTRDIRVTELPPASSTRLLAGNAVTTGVGTTTALVDPGAPWFRAALPGQRVRFRNDFDTEVGTAEIDFVDNVLGRVGLDAGVTVPAGAALIELIDLDTSFTQLRVFSSVITLPNFADFASLVVGLEVDGENLVLPIQNYVDSVSAVDRDGPAGPALPDSLVEFDTTEVVTGATAFAAGTRVTYSASNRLAVGQRVSVSGLPRFNVADALVVAASESSFTVETLGAIGMPVVAAAGVATVDFGERAAVGDTVEFVALDGFGRLALDSNGREVVLGTGTILAAYPDVAVPQPGTVIVEGDHTAYGPSAPNGYVMRTLTTGFRITAVDPVARTITTDLSPLGATSNVSFGIAPTAQYPAASTIRISPEFTNYERLFEGQRVYGAGITAGAMIVSIDRVAATVMLTPGSVGGDSGPIRVTQRDSFRSGFYPENFDDWVELDHGFNDFVEIKVGQRAELRDTFGGLLRVVTVTGVDGRFRTVGFENGSLNDLAGDVHTVRFLPVSNVRFGVIEGVGSGMSEILLQPVGLTPITVTARTVTTNIGTDLAFKTATFVVSTGGRTNDVTGSLGKMLGVYQQNDTRKTQVDVAVRDVTAGAGGTWVLRLDPLFAAYDRLRDVLADGGQVYGTPRMFSAAARLLAVDEERREVTLEAGGLDELAIEDLSRVTFVTLPTATPNPDQDLEFRFWDYISGTNPGDILLLQELPAIRKTITIDGALRSSDWPGAAAPNVLPPPRPNPGLRRVFIDGQRISQTRDGGLVTIGQEINGLEIIDAEADGSKVARLDIGGFQRGTAIKVDGSSSVIVEGANVGRTSVVLVAGPTVDARASNVRGITITGRYLEVDRGEGRRLWVPANDRVVFNTMKVGQKVRLLNADEAAISHGVDELGRQVEEFTIAALDRSNHIITFAESLPDQTVAANQPALVELAVATNNSVVGTTVVGGLTAGIYIDAGATRTYVVGGSIGTAEMDNQIGVYVAGKVINPERPAAKETFIGANSILPSQPIVITAAFRAGSREIALPATAFNAPLIGLKLLFEKNSRITPPFLPNTQIEIIGVDSARGVVLLNESATATVSLGCRVGHVFERVNDFTGEFVTVQLPSSIPIDDVYVGQTIAGTGLAPAGVQIREIDRANRTIRISQPFEESGFGILSFQAGAFPQTVVRGNRTGILLRGEDSRVTHSAIFDNTRIGIDVIEPGQQIGSPAVFAPGSGSVPVASFPATVTLRSTSKLVPLPSTFTGRGTDIVVGSPVYGPGIPAGTTVAALRTANGRLTEVTLSASPAVAGSSMQSLIGFGVRTNTASLQTVSLAAADRSRLFVGQDVHGPGLPEFTQIAGLRVGGPDEYILLSTTATPNFAALAGDLVFAERTVVSNRIYANGEYGIVVRHQDAGPLSTGRRTGLPTRIFANYFGLTGETTEVTSNRIAPIWYTFALPAGASATTVLDGQGKRIIQVASGHWINSVQAGQPVELLTATGTRLGTATVIAVDQTTGDVTLSEVAPVGTETIRKLGRLPPRHDVTGRVSRVDLLGNKFGLGTTSLPPASPLTPVPPSDPVGDPKPRLG